MAKFFGVDVILLRLLWVLAAFAGGSGVLAYIIAWIIVPEEKSASAGSGDVDVEETGWRADPATEEQARARRKRNVGLILIGAGFFFLARRALPRIIFSYSWPIVFIIVGLMLLLRDRK